MVTFPNLKKKYLLHLFQIFFHGVLTKHLMTLSGKNKLIKIQCDIEEFSSMESLEKSTI